MYYIIKKRPATILERFKKIIPGQIGISSITLAELQYGISKSADPEKNRAALHQFIIPLEILNFDISSSIEYGSIIAKLEMQGKIIGPLDTLIAAHARSLNLTPVTNNVDEFKRVDGLKIENWTVI